MPAAAQLINFDDIPDVPGGTVYVPELYKGYTFGGANGSGVANCGFVGQCSWLTNRGFWASQFPLNVSDPVSAWSNAGVTLTISNATPFTFTSAYLGARYGLCGGQGSSVTSTVNGYLAGSQTFTRNVTYSCNAFQLETFNWANIDLIEFVETTPNRTNFTVDDITLVPGVSAVPEPATVALLGTGLLAVGAFARRRRSA